MNKILLAGKSDIAKSYLENQIKQIDFPFEIIKIDDLELSNAGSEHQVTVIDLMVYTPGILDRIENYSMRNPEICVVAITYTSEVLFDELLLNKGVDLITTRDELGGLMTKKFLVPSQAS